MNRFLQWIEKIAFGKSNTAYCALPNDVEELEQAVHADGGGGPASHRVDRGPYFPEHANVTSPGDRGDRKNCRGAGCRAHLRRDRYRCDGRHRQVARAEWVSIPADRDRARRDRHLAGRSKKWQLLAARARNANSWNRTTPILFLCPGTSSATRPNGSCAPRR
jgi:hypothetical protein